MLSVWTVSASVFVFWIVWNLFMMWKWRHLSGLPGPTPLPFFGNLLAFRKLLPGEPVYYHIKDRAKQAALREKRLSLNPFVNPTHGWIKWKMLRVWFGELMPLVVMPHPKTAAAVFGRHGPDRKNELYDFLHDWLGDGILTSHGEKRRARRRLVAPSFHSLSLYYDVFVKHARALRDHVGAQHGDGSRFHIYPLCTRSALDIITECAVGKNPDALHNTDNPYVNAVYMQLSSTFQRFVSPWLWPNWIYWNLSPLGRAAGKSLKALHAHTDAMIASRRKELIAEGLLAASPDTAPARARSQSQPTHCKSFLDVLLTAVDDDGNPLSDAAIREEVDTLTFEGHDTTSAALTWAIYLIGSNPDTQRRLHKELDATMGRADVPSRELVMDTSELPFLRACMKESLRMLPSVPFIGRRVAPNDSFMVEGHNLAGANILIPLLGIHHNPAVFPDNWTFCPDRYMNGPCPLKPDPSLATSSFVAFSKGSRNCVGNYFAMQEEVAVLATFFKQFQVTVPEDQDVVLEPRLILRPKGGKLLIQVTPRTSATTTTSEPTA